MVFDNNRTTSTWGVSFVCLLILLASCSDQQASQEPESSIELVCDAQQHACSSSIHRNVDGYEGGSPETLLLSLVPLSPNLPALEPLNFELRVASANPADLLDKESLEAAWIEGRDMFMGEHQLEYSYQAESRSFLLKGMIPVCVTGSDMVWRINLQLKINNRKVLAFADLRTLKQA